jgi:hypothetical protein
MGPTIGIMRYTQPREGDSRGIRIVVFQKLTLHVVDSRVLIEARA